MEDPRALDLRPPPPGLYRLMRVVSRTYFTVLHQVRLHGHDRYPRRGRLIVMSNHPSYFDPWLVGLGLERRYVRWMAWDEIFDWPLVGPFVRACRAFPVDLDRPKPSTYKAARVVLERGLALGMFPEGERSPPGALGPFKPGATRLALLTETPILPVTIRGAHLAWPKTDALPRPGPRIDIFYHRPVDPRTVEPGAPAREREAALTARLARTIESAL